MTKYIGIVVVALAVGYVDSFLMPASVSASLSRKPTGEATFTVTAAPITNVRPFNLSPLKERPNASENSEPSKTTKKNEKEERSLILRILTLPLKLYHPAVFLSAMFYFPYRWKMTSIYSNPVFSVTTLFMLRWLYRLSSTKPVARPLDPIIHSEEQEKQLKAWTCRKCRATLFVALGREKVLSNFMNQDRPQKCPTCGAIGEENFVSDRKRILRHIGDKASANKFKTPLDKLPEEDQKRILEMTNGDRNLANKLLQERIDARARERDAQTAVDSESESSTTNKTTTTSDDEDDDDDDDLFDDDDDDDDSDDDDDDDDSDDDDDDDD